jgi:hypothetical protein
MLNYVFKNFDKEKCTALVDIPGIMHSPAEDEKRQANNQIALFDKSIEFPIFAYLPNDLSLSILNFQRKRNGFKPLDKQSLRQNYWTADVTLECKFNKKGRSFTLIDAEQIDIQDTEPETIIRSNILFNPRTI